MENNYDGAQNLAIAALGWIGADGEMINRFMGVTGIEADAMRQAASEPGFLAGVLDFLLAHEPTLMRFCDDNNLDPAQVQAARQKLAQDPVPGPGDFD
jgi:hypothetical protein